MTNTDQEIAYFCENVRTLRRFFKLSQKEMARTMGIGLYSLRKIESGVLPPRLGMDVLFHLYKGFGVLPHALVSPDGVKKHCHSEEATG